MKISPADTFGGIREAAKLSLHLTLYNAVRRGCRQVVEALDRVASDGEDRNRRIYYLVFTVLGPPPALFFGFQGLLTGDLTLFVLTLVMSVFVFVGAGLLLRVRDAAWVYRANLALFSTTLIYSLLIGGQGGSKSLWILTLPLIAVFLLGKNEGLGWCLVIIGCISGYFFLGQRLFFDYAYNQEYFLRFIIVYLMITAGSFWFEFLRSSYSLHLQKKNEELTDEVKNRRIVESSLKKVKDKLEIAISSSGASVWEYDVRKDRFIFPREWLDCIGIEDDEECLKLASWMEMIHPEDRPTIEAFAARRIFEEVGSFEIEYRMKDATGEWKWIRSNGVCSERDKKGNPIRVLGAHKDDSERKAIEQEREGLIHDLQQALERVRTLRGMLPICSSCKKIRDDKGYWNRIESYISRHSDAAFSHGICPDCAEKLYGDEDWYKKMKGEDP